MDSSRPSSTFWPASRFSFSTRKTSAAPSASALLGLQTLVFFGISLVSFQIDGGMLPLTAALSMLNAQPAKAHVNNDEVHKLFPVLARGV